MVRDTVDDLFMVTSGRCRHMIRSLMSIVVWLFALLFKAKGACGDDESLFPALFFLSHFHAECFVDVETEGR